MDDDAEIGDSQLLNEAIFRYNGTSIYDKIIR